MAYGNNTNAPTGFKPNSFMGGSLWNGATTEFEIASAYGTSLFQYDPVTLLNDGTIGIGVAGSSTIGVFLGVQYTSTSGEIVFSNRWVGGTVTQGSVNAKAVVCNAKGVLYDAQVSTSAGGTVAPVALAQTDIGQNINFGVAVTAFTPTTAPNQVNYAPNPGSGNTATGISGYYLDKADMDTTATKNFKIIALTPIPGNVSSGGGIATGTLNFNNALVLMNNHIPTSAGTTGV